MCKPYSPVPVDAAHRIAQEYGKDVVVIVAYDHSHGMLHGTTYGATWYDKIVAAELGPLLVSAAGGYTPESRTFEDFREPALKAERVDALLSAASKVATDLGALRALARANGKPVPEFLGLEALKEAISNMKKGDV